jgi:hypothetical protein
MLSRPEASGALTAHAVHAQEREYSVASHQAMHRAIYPTALNDLNALVSAGLLTRQRVGEAHVFFPVRDRAERLPARTTDRPADV